MAGEASCRARMCVFVCVCAYIYVCVCVTSTGAIYLWAKLPPGCEDDDAVVAWLVKQHGVTVIPGSSCGAPGHIRAAFANLKPDLCKDAAARLKAGLTQLVEGGPAVLTRK